MNTRVKKLTLLSASVAVAMILSYLESLIPAFVAIPGVKVGIANVAVIFTLYTLGWGEAIAVSLTRVLLMGLLFGNMMSLWYSLAGAALSLAVMIIMKKFTPANTVSVSISGGIFHNIGQIGVASLILETNVLLYYLPFLLLAGILAGIATGAAAALLIKKIGGRI